MKTSYVHTAKSFLRKVINQRKRLLILGRSFKNEMAVRKALAKLEGEMQRNFTDRGMAVFIRRHGHLIEILITGENSASHQSHRDQYRQLKAQAGIITEAATIADEHATFEMNLN